MRNRRLLKIVRISIALGSVIVVLTSHAGVLAANPFQLVIGGSGATPWAVGPIKPGDSGTQAITVQNAGTETGDLNIWVSDVVNTDGTPTEFEPVPNGQGELGGLLQYTVVSARLSTNIAMPVLMAGLPQSASDVNYLLIKSLRPSETVTITCGWQLPSTAGNIVQGDSLSFSINYQLVQTTTTVPTTTTIAPPTTTTAPPTTTTAPPITTTAPPTTTTTPPTATTAPPTTTTVPPTTTTAPPTTTAAPPTTTTTPPPTTTTAPPPNGGTSYVHYWDLVLAILGILVLMIISAIVYSTWGQYVAAQRRKKKQE